MIFRKLKEGASIIYRFWLWPFKRAFIEIRTNSILRPGSYLSHTRLCGRNYLGRNTVLRRCRLGFGSYVNNNGDMTDTEIGKYTSVGSGVSTVIGAHPIDTQVAMHPAFTNPEKMFGFSYVQEKTFEDTPGRTSIGNDVWIGNNVLIMGGVAIGDGAVIGTGALVTKNVPPYSVNVGIPAKTIKYRFSQEEIEKLLKMKWWDRDEDWIRKHISEFGDIKKFTETAEKE